MKFNYQVFQQLNQEMLSEKSYLKNFKKVFAIYFFILVALLTYYIVVQFIFYTSSIQSNQFLKLKQINQVTSTSLKQAVRTKYFRIIRINLQADCPFWAQKKLCSSGGCQVCRCDQKDLPHTWTTTDKIKSTTVGLDQWSLERDTDNFTWIWHVQDLQNDNGEYFDLLQNKESFTGYDGSFIWDLIYNQNCFSGNFDKMCKQEKFLYQIISGLHSSISTHVAYFWKDIPKGLPKKDEDSEQKYYFNKKMYAQMVGNYEQRIKNLYFLYQVLLKSILTIKHKIIQYPIISNNITQDLKSKILIKNFINQLEKYSDSFNTLDFFYSKQPYVVQYQKYIHNISKIMDCVDCQKCKLFGKMQTYGIGTALKIIFGYPNLTRNELVALFNTLNQISLSIQVNSIFNKEEKEQLQFLLKSYILIGGIIFIIFYLKYLYLQKKPTIKSSQVDQKKIL